MSYSDYQYPSGSTGYESGYQPYDSRQYSSSNDPYGQYSYTSPSVQSLDQYSQPPGPTDYTGYSNTTDTGYTSPPVTGDTSASAVDYTSTPAADYSDSTSGYASYQYSQGTPKVSSFTSYSDPVDVTSEPFSTPSHYTNVTTQNETTSQSASSFDSYQYQSDYSQISRPYAQNSAVPEYTGSYQDNSEYSYQSEHNQSSGTWTSIDQYSPYSHDHYDQSTPTTDYAQKEETGAGNVDYSVANSNVESGTVGGSAAPAVGGSAGTAVGSGYSHPDAYPNTENHGSSYQGYVKPVSSELSKPQYSFGGYSGPAQFNKGLENTSNTQNRYNNNRARPRNFGQKIFSSNQAEPKSFGATSMYSSDNYSGSRGRGDGHSSFQGRNKDSYFGRGGSNNFSANQDISATPDQTATPERSYSSQRAGESFPNNRGFSYRGNRGGNNRNFSPRGSSFSPRGSSFSPRGSSYTPRGSSYTPRGSSFTSRGSSFTPRGSSFTPRGSSFTPRGSSFTPRGSSFSARGSSFSAKGSSYPANPDDQHNLSSKPPVGSFDARDKINEVRNTSTAAGRPAVSTPRPNKNKPLMPAYKPPEPVKQEMFKAPARPQDRLLNEIEEKEKAQKAEELKKSAEEEKKAEEERLKALAEEKKRAEEELRKKVADEAVKAAPPSKPPQTAEEIAYEEEIQKKIRESLVIINPEKEIALLKEDPSKEVEMSDELRNLLKTLTTDYLCKLCSVRVANAQMGAMHYNGKNHLKKLRNFVQTNGRSAGFNLDTLEKSENEEVKPGEKKAEIVEVTVFDEKQYCNICKLFFSQPCQADIHYKGKNHAKKLKTVGTGNGPEVFECKICCVTVTAQEHLTAHMNGYRHKQKVRKLDTNETYRGGMRGRGKGPGFPFRGRRGRGIGGGNIGNEDRKPFPDGNTRGRGFRGR
ncbi:hypothetical protein BsWGS_26758 [Bradybaena similaris]